MEKEIDTMNVFAVGIQGGDVIIHNTQKVTSRMKPHEALNLAAWLVTNAQVQMFDIPFEEYLQKITNIKNN